MLNSDGTQKGESLTAERANGEQSKVLARRIAISIVAVVSLIKLLISG